MVRALMGSDFGGLGCGICDVIGGAGVAGWLWVSTPAEFSLGEFSRCRCWGFGVVV